MQVASMLDQCHGHARPMSWSCQTNVMVTPDQTWSCQTKHGLARPNMVFARPKMVLPQRCFTQAAKTTIGHRCGRRVDLRWHMSPAADRWTCSRLGLTLEVSDTCFSGSSMSQTRDQQRFTISQVATIWHELMVSQRIIWPFVLIISGLLDQRCS